MKKLISFFLVAALVFSMAMIFNACGDKDNDADTTTTEGAVSDILRDDVLAPLKNSAYTMSVSVSITDDGETKTGDVTKAISGDNASYSIVIPDTEYRCTTIKADGKFYIDNGTNFSTITEEQYNALASGFDVYFDYDFDRLSFKESSEVIFEDFPYTRELYVKPDGSKIALWFEGNTLKYIEENPDTDATIMIEASLYAGADENLFKPDSTSIEVEFSEMEEVYNLITGSVAIPDETTTQSDGDSTTIKPGSSTTTALIMSTTKQGETTTARRGSVITPGTTAQNGLNTTKVDKTTNNNQVSTNATSAGGNTNTTTKGGGGTPGNVEQGNIPRPNVTYFDKYVKNVLLSGEYTATMSANQDGIKAAYTQYVKGDNSAVVVSTFTGESVDSGLNIQGVQIRFIDGKCYVVVPFMGKYAEIKDVSGMDDLGSVSGSIQEMFDSMGDEMTYAGLSGADGVNCEMYTFSDGSSVKWYFNSKGLQSVVQTDASGNSTTLNVTLVAGVSKPKMVTSPDDEYKRTTEEELYEYFGGLLG